MRRAALRGCALLLRSSASASGAAGEPIALFAADPRVVAAAAVACGRQLWAPWSQAPFHAAAPLGQQANDDSGGTSGKEPPQLVKRLRNNKDTKLLPVRFELAGELQPLAALAGVADAAALASKVAALGPTRERGMLQHGAAVAQLLLSLGVPHAQLAALLLRCPLLFSWPAEQRPTLLFGQLARLGLSAAEAARCFQQHPAAAGARSFEPAITGLAPLFATGSKASSTKSGEQLLGDWLRKVPAVVGLLSMQPNLLQQRIDSLVQRYGPHWEQQNKQALIVSALQQYSLLLTRSPEHLLALEAVLQRELGQQPGDGTRLLACILQRHARAAGCSPETLRQRARALVAEFGLERLPQAGRESLAELLHVDSTTWQRALAVWRLLGVADPAALALRNTHPLTLNWLRPDLLARLAALQRLLPWQPAAADVVQHCFTYVAAYAPHRLIGRLLFLQQEGVLPLLVANKQAAKQQWQQRGLPATMGAQAEPQLLSLRDIAVLSDAKLCALLAQAQAAQPEQPGSGDASSGSSTGGSNVAERYQAFMAGLPQLPAYQQLLAAGDAESRRLAALLPPKLRLVAGKPGQRQEEHQQQEEEQGGE